MCSVVFATMRRVVWPSLSSPAARVTLADGHSMPILGLGVWNNVAATGLRGSECTTAVTAAIASGYRHIDTAAMYDNEEEVGDAIRACGVPRSELFITTKLRGDRQGYDSAISELEASLSRLKLDYVDLYLIHSYVRGHACVCFCVLLVHAVVGRMAGEVVDCPSGRKRGRKTTNHGNCNEYSRPQA